MSKPVFTNVKLDALVSLPFSVRSEESDEDLAGLAESVSEVGMLEPILVRPSKDRFKFEIVAGERRVRAARKLGLKEVPATVETLSDEMAYLIQLTENAQRKDLSDMEKAHALDRYLKTFKCTQEVLAKKMGKTQGWVSQLLAMLQIPESITRVIKSGEFGAHQAREVLSANSEQQQKIIDKINETGKMPTVTEIQKMKQTVKCDHCGEPVEKPVHLNGKFYHDDCAEQVKAETEKGLVPETKGGFEVSDKEFEEADRVIEEAKPGKASEKGLVKPEPLLTGYAWTCPDCGAKFIINHVEWPGTTKAEHRLEVCGEV